MSDEPTVQSQHVYERLYEAFGRGSDMHVSYTPTSRGDPRFIIYGITHQGQEFIADLHSIIDSYDPREVLVQSTASGTHISLVFNAERVEGEPTPIESWDRIKPRLGETNVTVNECTLCRQKTPDAYPPLRLYWPTPSPYESPNVETHYLCIDCSPGHFDDVVRSVTAFGIADAEVDSLQFDAHGGESEWVEYEAGENPYIDDVVDLVEQRLVEADSGQ